VHICLYTETALPKIGGHEMVVDALARQFQERGHEVTVLAPFPRLPLRPRDHTLPYRVVRHIRFYSHRFLVDWYQWWLRRLFRRMPFDVLHCHGVYPPGYLATQVRQRLGVPVVITSHGGDVHNNGYRLRKAIVRQRQEMTLRSADALVAISQFTREGYCRFGADPGRIVCIPNGVDPRPYAQRVVRPASLDPAIRDRRFALFLGRLKRRKGVDLLLQAFEHLATSASDGVQLVIAGDGEERKALQQQAQQLNLQERVRFVGTVHGEKKTYLLQNARCTVVPSRVWEAFPLVVLESYAAGTPVLAARVPGLEDLVVPGKTGWLVEPGAPQSLAGVLHTAMTDATAARELGSEAAESVQEYTWAAVAQKHLQLYEDLLARRQLRPAL
jgi:glycosyltransferase involved in cell wall biosynthesis